MVRMTVWSGSEKLAQVWEAVFEQDFTSMDSI